MGVQKVTNIGGVIANATQNADGTLSDHGKLNYSGDLKLQDIEDQRSESNKGFNISTSIGTSPKGQDQNSAKHPNGSTTLGLQSTGNAQDQLTKATMGQGTVKNASDATNRDINNTQEITRDQVTGLLNGSVTVDHRLVTESGREQIIKEQKDIPESAKGFEQAISDASLIFKGISNGLDIAKTIDHERAQLTTEERAIFDQTLIEYVNSHKSQGVDSIAPVIVGGAIVVEEAAAVGIGAAALCIRTPACLRAMGTIMGAVGLEVLSVEDRKKAAAPAAPKPMPSTSGNSATGGPSGSGHGPDDKNDNNIKNTYQSIKDSPNYPRGFRETQSGTTNNTVKNQEILSELRKVEPGKWSKVYKDGLDAAGNRVSIHYFRSQSGRVFNVKTKQGWSNIK